MSLEEPGAGIDDTSKITQEISDEMILQALVMYSETMAHSGDTEDLKDLQAEIARINARITAKGKSDQAKIDELAQEAEAALLQLEKDLRRIEDEAALRAYIEEN